MDVTVAVDANGADLGPSEVAAGAAIAAEQGVRVVLFGPAAELGDALGGNVEGTELTNGKADVVVTDGFTGNVALKVMEGVSQTMLAAIREVAMSSPRTKAGGLLLRPALRRFRDEIDPEGPGGAYLLGLRRLGVVPHGRFTRYGISQAILLAARGVRAGIVERTQAALASAGALKGAPPVAASE